MLSRLALLLPLATGLALLIAVARATARDNLTHFEDRSAGIEPTLEAELAAARCRRRRRWLMVVAVVLIIAGVRFLPAID